MLYILKQRRNLSGMKIDTGSLGYELLTGWSYETANNFQDSKTITAVEDMLKFDICDIRGESKSMLHIALERYLQSQCQVMT